MSPPSDALVTAKPPQAAMPHVRQLDGMRAIAILIVFVAHCGLEDIVPGGFGVTVFFFLSGYLITSLMRGEAAQTGRIDLGAFYIRRTLRIWPPLYITMPVVGIGALLFLPGTRIDPLAVLAQMLFVTNYAGLWGHDGGIPQMPLWSLAVEEHFYLIFPLLFSTLLIRIAPARAAAWCAVTCVVVLLVRLASAAVMTNIGYIYYFSHTRIDSILFGCCLALWSNPVMDAKAWRPRAWHAIVALGVLLFNFLYRDPVFRETWRYSLQGAALFVLFSYVLWDQGALARALGSAPMRLMGLYSYTFYLIHMLMIALVLRAWPGLPVVGVMLSAGLLSLLYCAAMYRLVEQPMARWRRALHRDGQAGAVAV